MVIRVLTPYYRINQDDVNTLSAFCYWLFTIRIQGKYPSVNFDSQHPDGSGPLNLNVSVRSAAHTALAREIAAASAVLLKNTASETRGLPLGSPKTIAVIGQDAKMPTSDCYLNECNDGTMVIGLGFHLPKFMCINKQLVISVGDPDHIRWITLFHQ
jgi:beta-glucosidase